MGEGEDDDHLIGAKVVGLAGLAELQQGEEPTTVMVSAVRASRMKLAMAKWRLSGRSAPTKAKQRAIVVSSPCCWPKSTEMFSNALSLAAGNAKFGKGRVPE